MAAGAFLLSVEQPKLWRGACLQYDFDASVMQATDDLSELGAGGPRLGADGQGVVGGEVGDGGTPQLPGPGRAGAHRRQHHRGRANLLYCFQPV